MKMKMMKTSRSSSNTGGHTTFTYLMSRAGQTQTPSMSCQEDGAGPQKTEG